MPGEEPKHIFEPGGTEVSTAAGGARRYRKPLKSLRWCDIEFLFGGASMPGTSTRPPAWEHLLLFTRYFL